MSGRLIVICGLPGSGKTTLARQLEQTHQAIRFNPDEWMATIGFDLYDGEARQRVEQLQWQLAQRLLELGCTVIIEWGTWQRRERDELRTRARELGAAVELRYLVEPVDVLWERVRDRGMEAAYGSRPLTIDDLRAYETWIEPPDADEMALFDPPSDGDTAA